MVGVAVVILDPVWWSRIDLYELSDGRCTVSSAEYLPGPGFTQTTEMLHVWLGGNVPWQGSLLMLNEGSPTSSTAPMTMGRGELFFTFTVVVRTRRTPGGTLGISVPPLFRLISWFSVGFVSGKNVSVGGTTVWVGGPNVCVAGATVSVGGMDGSADDAVTELSVGLRDAASGVLPQEQSSTARASSAVAVGMR